MISLVKDTINKNDIDDLIEWLKSYPRLTKGPVTIELEEKWSKIIGSKYSVFCNSGSSANLLMLLSLLETNKIAKGDKVVVPALAWATDLSPVMQLGLEPIICDVNLQDLSIDINAFEDIIKKHSPKALILVSVLGLVPDMDRIVDLCNQHNIILLEDACESMGSKYKNKNLGTFGLMSSFSTYFGHHISTIEGGFVSTDSFEMYEILKAVRSHGWDRDLSDDTKEKLRSEWGVSEFESLYTFYYSGLNVRSTDLQAYIGLSQVERLQEVSEARNENFFLYQKYIKNNYWKIASRDNTYVSNFAYPVISPKRSDIVKDLITNNVEVRPLICGSMSTQPFYIKEYGKKELKNSNIVDKYGFYIPNHPYMNEEDVLFVSNIINKHTKE